MCLKYLPLAAAEAGEYDGLSVLENSGVKFVGVKCG